MSRRNMEIIKIWRNNFIELFLETYSFFIPPKHLKSYVSFPILIAFLLGGIGHFFHPLDKTSVPKLIWIAFMEELTWRVLIQEQLNMLMHSKKFHSVSASCIVTSALFALFHLFQQSAAMAALVFFPAMVFGMLWDAYKNPYVCIGMHFWYNFTFFYF